MSNSSLVTYTKFSPNCNKPRKYKIDTITIHCFVGQVTAEEGCNAEKFVNYDPVNGASCNYVVGHDGSIGLCVEEENRSWCSGNRENDHRAVTIEVASETVHPYKVTEAAYNSLIKLVADICKRNVIEKLLWQGEKNLIGQVEKQNMTVHRWFQNKACPGEYLYNLHGEIANKVNELLNLGAEKEEVSEEIYIVKERETLSEIASRYGMTYQELAKYNGIENPNLIYTDQEIKIPGAKKTEIETEARAVSYFAKYNGTSGSIVTALNSIGENSSYSYRENIAKANGIVGYKGTASQNTNLVSLLKQGKLIKP